MKRYDLGVRQGAPAMCERPEGEYVRWADLAAQEPVAILRLSDFQEAGGEGIERRYLAHAIQGSRKLPPGLYQLVLHAAEGQEQEPPHPVGRTADAPSHDYPACALFGRGPYCTCVLGDPQEVHVEGIGTMWRHWCRGSRRFLTLPLGEPCDRCGCEPVGSVPVVGVGRHQ